MVAVRRVDFPTRVPLASLFPFRALLMAMPWLVGISTVASASDFRPRTVLTWVVLHTTGLLAAGFAIVALRGIFRWAGVTEVGVVAVVLTGGVVGMVKALCTALLEPFVGFGGGPPEALVARGLGGVIVGVWLIGTIAYARAGLDRLDQARQDLIRQNVAKRLAEEATVSRPEIEKTLHAITLLREDSQGRKRDASPDKIREVVDSTIRPLSRALWSVESRRYPALRTVSLYRIALRSLPPRAWLIALVWAGTSVTGLAVSSGLVTAVAYSAAVGSVALVVFSFVRLGWTQSVVVSVVVVALAAAASVLVGFVLAGLVVPGLWAEIPAPILVAGVVWMTLVTTGASVISGVLELRAVIAKDLEDENTQHLIDEYTDTTAEAASTRRLATRLHGVVQSTLLGVAAGLDQKTLSAHDADAALADVVAQLHAMAQPTHGSLDPALGRISLDDLVRSWRAILDVTVDPHSAAHLLELVAERPESIEIIREALTNAHRHGRATVVTIETREHDGQLALRVSDNGYGPRRGEPGLGSALLDRWTGTQWSLSSLPQGGSTLIVPVPETNKDNTH